MAHTSKTILVNADPTKAFEYLADFTRHSEWSQHPLTIEKTSDGPVAVGTTFRSSAKMYGEHRAGLRVTEFTPGQKLAFEASDDTGTWRHEIALATEGGGTRITKSIEQIRPAGLRSRILTMVLFPFVAPKGVTGDLERIKARLESGG